MTADAATSTASARSAERISFMSKYIRKNGSSKVTLIFAVILAAIIIAWVLLETTAAQGKPA